MKKLDTFISLGNPLLLSFSFLSSEDFPGLTHPFHLSFLSPEGWVNGKISIDKISEVIFT